MTGGAGDCTIVADKFAEFKHNANEVIHFKLVRSEKDFFEDRYVFHPEMSHQLFGDSESIFGYKDLRIDIYSSACRMNTFVKLNYSEKIAPEKFDGVTADDVLKLLKPKLQPGFLTNSDDFIASLAKEANFKPYGSLIHSYKRTDKLAGGEREFEVYKTLIDDRDFRSYLERLQPFLLFFVDAASYIDSSDERWDFYLLFEKYRTEDNSIAYAFAGYQTVYNYYAYPQKLRPRISQVLIMPPFQKMGHCAQLIQAFYNQVTPQADVLDTTVEDPSEDFQRVRDFVDVQHCMRLECFSPGKLKEGFNKDMSEQAREKFKINKRQARRVYEILRLQATNVNSTLEFRQYRLDVKNRLNRPFQKQGRIFERLKKALNTDEYSATMEKMSSEQRLSYLHNEFKDITAEYRKVLNRLTLV